MGMNGDPNLRVRKTAEEALQRLSAELEAGKSEALKNYLAAMSRFRRYSWNNVLLISAQRPNATQLAGIHTWNDLGRTVKKGEKGIMIFAPVIVKRETAATEREPKEAFRLAGFRTAYVFDRDQTEGKPLPEFAKPTGDPKDYTDKLKTIAARHGIAVEYDSAIAPAQGMSSGGRIRLLPGLGAAEEFSVLSHELAHEMLHRNKEARSQPEVIRETQAEAVAYVVSRGIGLETNTAAADYIKLYNGDKETLARSLSAIQETSSKILDELLPEERQLPAPPQTEARAQGSATPDQTQTSPTPESNSPQQPQTQSLEPATWDR
jgi:antirestriction protein ArdC